ncbi:histidine phosphatase family protein [Pediococcus claussenii]|uniref:phosphoglycerate mutase (2,3-diphosphoglycerate-dependent) n=1 Tax=Pediococcus claussenii (strain ATCC BAA-344 / DSM 14800 / JCM 18046 / KCTC 3811 / LMG 21948 / P06) TaxID=701521 RepID=G8PEM4_PEDCP|nr:histidine phosphatase family protein [Pediococcus claussenii]AEV95633.1 alpha-ribazole-5'-phosphate phosphatase [Pediococcus claussenii ATCC BAA-344]ANZ69153.1 hypothetical protein AYR57_02020 [Pediococcus claussenii]ANZ70970.1 hypothetical protein AYR58_02020 [Pediococcus claussenii]KRN20134.1 cobC protein [Pediococcus claussenii]
MDIILIRHGQTDYNLQKKFYGSADVPLNQNGIEDAQKLKDIFQKNAIQFDRVYFSPLKRAVETMETCVNKSAVRIKMSNLVEKSFGHWEGLDANQIESKYPVEWQKWINDPFKVTPRGAEKFDSFVKRVQQSTDYLINDAQVHQAKTILIVTHLGVLRVIDQYWNDPQDVFWNIQYKSGKYTIYQMTNRIPKLMIRNIG